VRTWFQNVQLQIQLLSRYSQEAAASSDEQRHALRAAQRKVLDLRQELLVVKAECAVADEAAAGSAVLRKKVAELESSPRVTLALNISAVDHIALNDAAREARSTATREAEMRFKLESRALQRRSDEQEEHIERLLRGTASNADKSEKIQRLTVEMEAAAAAAMRSKQAQGEAERRAAAAEDEADQLRSKLRAERETSASLSDTWSEQVEKLRADNRALRVKAQAEEDVAGVPGAGERIGGTGGGAAPGWGGVGEGATDDDDGKMAGSSPLRSSDLVLAARAVMGNRSGDEAMRLIARNKELAAAATAMEARERCALERLAEAEAATATQRDRAGATLLKARAAMEAAGAELAAAETRAAVAEAAAETERDRNRVAIKEQTRKMTHEMRMHQQMLVAIHEKRLAVMEVQLSEAAAAREREETALAFREADDRLKAFLNFGHEEGSHVGGTVRAQLEAEANLAANAMRPAALPKGRGSHLEAVHDVFRPKGSPAAVAAVVDVAALAQPPPPVDPVKKTKNEVAVCNATVDALEKEMKELEWRTNAEDKEYLYLNDKLEKALTSLDGVETHGMDDLRALRKGAVKRIQMIIDRGDAAKAAAPASRMTRGLRPQIM
jgi:hypothetical protein